MARNLSSRLSSPDTDFLRSEDDHFDVTHQTPTLDFTTLGLHPYWQYAFDWATENGVAHEFLHAVNATLAWKKPNTFGTFLTFIASEEIYPTLSSWSKFDKSAKLLNQLAEAIQKSSEILSRHPPLLNERSGKKQFQGELKSHYLIALLTEGLPLGTESERAWLNVLKLWVLTHAVDRALDGNIQDAALRTVATTLRIACNQDDAWRIVFMGLQSNATDFDALSRRLIQKSAKFLQPNLQISITSSQRQLLQAIIKLGTREHAEDEQDGQARWPIIDIPNFRQQIHPAQYQPNSGHIAEEDQDEPSNVQWIAGDEDTGETLVTFESDSEVSFTHQRLQGNGILLYCTEELQYLPWSWGKLNPLEKQQIDCWLKQSLSSSKIKLRYLSAIIWMAINLGRSFKRTLDIQIDGQLIKEWGLNSNTWTLMRLPPRREPGWRPRTAEQSDWVTPPAAHQIIQLPQEIQEIVQERLVIVQDASCVGDLWDTRWGESAESNFRQEFSTLAPRVTGGMLSSVLPQQIVEASGDQTLARLISSHPKSSLPSPCAYSSWSSYQVSSVLNKFGQPTGEKGMPDNAMGSLLDPVELMLINSIRSATNKLAVLLNGNDIVEFHNGFVAYLSVALLAATGARPIRDPFENLSHFDFEHKFVYVSDKVSNNLRQARLIPLPEKLCRIIEHDYLDHLIVLANQIKLSNPQLANDISNLASGRIVESMPFLFLLTQHAQSWRTVSESEIEKITLFDWPLPLNHFRHRLSRQLRKYDVDTEVIDAILGHAETGAATHGDFSFRTWSEDISIVRPAIEAAFSSLSFMSFAGWSSASTGLGKSIAVQNAVRDFGSVAREKERRKRYISSIRDAHFQISQFLADRKLEDISKEEVDLLSRKLLFSPDGMPLPSGHQKYSVLLRLIERTWKQHGKKVKASKRYQIIQEENSPFTTTAPGSLTIVEKIENLLLTIPSQPTSRISLHDAAIVSSILLCFENKISSKKLLTDILHARNFRLVSLQGKPYLEYAESLQGKKDDVPTKRYNISDRTAMYLNRLLDSRRSPYDQHSTNASLCSIVTVLEKAGRLPKYADVQTAINTLADLVDQSNSMTMPGIVAGYLAERVPSFSLMWRDWARQKLGYQIQIKNVSERIINEVDSLGHTTLVEAAMTAPRDIATNELQQNARIFLYELHKLIDSYRADCSTATSAISRKDLSRDIQSIIEKYDAQVSTSIQLLARWVNSLLFRRGKDGLIRLPSIQRYLVALSPIFEQVGYSADILCMDDEDITIFYSELLEASTAKDTKYVVARLIDFHSWAKREYAIEEPDWLDMPETFGTSHVSPGLITETEYQGALQLLLNLPKTELRYHLAAPFLLMLCYRFGLRSSEALHMLRSDLLKFDQLLVVLVQNNRFRKLKTKTSRRQVPLLFSLSEAEENILSMWLAEAESTHGNDYNTALFSDSNTINKLMDAGRIKKSVLAALKVATGNQAINIHHARHSAGNFVAISIVQENLASWENASPLCQPEQALNAEKILLGSTGLTRRKMWAISRFLGHVCRETTTKNYLHILGEMADSRTGCEERNSGKIKLTNVINLNLLPRLAPVSTELLEQLAPVLPEVTTTRVLKLMRLLARGRPIIECADALAISPEVAKNINQLLSMIGKKIKLSKTKLSERQGQTSENVKLIHRLKEAAWNRLIAFASKAEQNESQRVVTNLNIQDLAEMVGATRQILLWKPAQLTLLLSFIKQMSIGEDEYTLVMSNLATENLRSQIVAHEFKSALDIKDMQAEQTFQMDATTTGSEEFRVQSKCAFVIKESNVQSIRNSIECLVLFVAYAIVCMRHDSTENPH